MIPGTATQLVAVAAAPSAGASNSTAAQTGDGAFAEALAGAETVLDTADAAAGAATPATNVATPETDGAHSSESTGEGGAVSSQVDAAADGSDTHVDASQDSNGAEASDDVTAGNGTDVPTDAIAQAVVSASTAAVLTSVMASDNAIVTEQPAQVVAVGQSDAVEAAIRVATRTMVDDTPAAPATHSNPGMPDAQTEATAVVDSQQPSTTNEANVSNVHVPDMEESAPSNANTVRNSQTLPASHNQEAEVPASGEGTARVNDASLPKTEPVTGPNPGGVVPRGRDIAAAAQAAHAARLASRATPDATSDQAVESVATSVVPTAATPAAPAASAVQSPQLTDDAPVPTASLITADQLPAEPVQGNGTLTVDRVAPASADVDVVRSTAMPQVAEAPRDTTSHTAPAAETDVDQASIQTQPVSVPSIAAGDSAEEPAPVIDATDQPQRVQRDATSVAAPAEPVVEVVAESAAADMVEEPQSHKGTSRKVAHEASTRGIDARAVRTSDAVAVQASPQSAVQQAAPTSQSAQPNAPVIAEPLQQQSQHATASADQGATAPQSDVVSGTLQAGPEATRVSFEQRSSNLAQFAMSQERIDHIAEQLAMRLKLSHAAGGSEVQLQLRPRELGEVTVQMNVRHGMVAATVVVDRADTGKLLQTNLDDLRRSLESQGLDVQQFNVDVRGGNAGNPFERMSSFGGGGSFSRGAGEGGTAADAASDINPGLTGDRTVTPEDIHDGNVSVLV